MRTCLIVTPDAEYGRMLFLELSGRFDCVLLSGAEKTFPAGGLTVIDRDRLPRQTVRRLLQNPGCVLLSSADATDDEKKSAKAVFRKPFSMEAFLKEAGKIRDGRDTENGRETDGIAEDLTPPLSEKERALMLLLKENAGEAVSRERIREAIGGKSSREGNSVEVFVSLLRRKIKKATGRSPVETVRGVGYRWNEP